MGSMTENISPDANARREAARDRGRFGVQNHSDPEVIIIPVTGSVDQHIQETLAHKAEALKTSLPKPGERVLTSELQPGHSVLTETNTTGGPFSFAIRSDRDLRRRWRDADMPWKLTVTGRRRAPEDGHTDDELTFDLNGEPLVLTFHRDRAFIIAH